MSNSPTDNPAVNAEALAGALRALGMLYGASQPLAEIIAGAKSEAEAIRMYIERERPHLLASYDLETLVKMEGSARGEDRRQARRGTVQPERQAARKTPELVDAAELPQDSARRNY